MPPGRPCGANAYRPERGIVIRLAEFDLGTMAQQLTEQQELHEGAIKIVAVRVPLHAFIEGAENSWQVLQICGLELWYTTRRPLSGGDELLDCLDLESSRLLGGLSEGGHDALQNYLNARISILRWLGRYEAEEPEEKKR